jgi:hypothetical protein
VKIVTDPKVQIGRRSSAALAMRNMAYLGTSAAPCLSVLAHEASSTDTSIRGAARASLRVLMRPQGIAVPGMSWTNAAPDPALRRLAIGTAISFATNSEQFTYELISNATNDPDPAVRSDVVRYLDRRKDYLDSTAKHE